MSDAGVIFRRFTFCHRGRTWSLRRPTLGTEARYADHLEGKALEEARRIGQLDAKAGEVALAAVQKDREVDHYGWCQPGFVTSLSSPDNVVAFLVLWFRQDYPHGHPRHVGRRRMRRLHQDRQADLLALLWEAMTEPHPAHKSRPTFGGGARVSLLELLAQVAAIGRGTLPADLENMDRWTIANILCHPRDPKTGDVQVSLKGGPGAFPPSPEELWREWGRSFGLPEWVVAARRRHDEQQQKQAAGRR